MFSQETYCEYTTGKIGSVGYVLFTIIFTLSHLAMFIFFIKKIVPTDSIIPTDSAIPMASALILVFARTRRCFFLSFSSGIFCDWWFILCYMIIPGRVFGDKQYVTWGHNFVHFVDFLYLSDMFLTALVMLYAFQPVERATKGISPL